MCPSPYSSSLWGWGGGVSRVFSKFMCLWRAGTPSELLPSARLQCSALAVLLGCFSCIVKHFEPWLNLLVMMAGLFTCTDYLHLATMNKFSWSLPLGIILFVITSVLLGCLQLWLCSNYSKRRFMAFTDLVSSFPEIFPRLLIQTLNEVIAGNLDAVWEFLVASV